MAENFVSFLGIAKTGTEKQIVPYATSSNHTCLVGDAASQGTNSRTVNSTVVVNGFYVTSIVTNKATNISLIIKDINYPTRPIYVIQNISVPIGTSFFLERSITLTSTQGLFLMMPSGLNDANVQMHASASCIEINK